MDKFLETYTIPTVNQKENMNWPSISNETESVILKIYNQTKVQDSEHVKVCIILLRVESVLPATFQLSCTQAPLAFKARCSGAHLPGARPPGKGVQCGLRPFASWGEPLHMGLFSHSYVTYQSVRECAPISLPHLPVSLWFLLYVFSCWQSFLLVFRLFL